jgi:ribonuclease HI
MEKQQSFFSTPKPVVRAVPHFTIYVDGASRGNPGPAGAGIYILYDQKPLVKKGIYLGTKTNNQAEYLALVLALCFLQEECEKMAIAHPHVAIISDSELLIKQLKGQYKVKNESLLILKKIVDDFLSRTSYHCKHVLRHHNKEADALANLGIDKKHKIPTAFVKILADYGLHF